MKTLKRGSVGADVNKLQSLLKEKGCPVSPDGIFGLQTHISVCKFQQDNGLTADGIVGQATWDALFGGTQPQEKPAEPPPIAETIDFAKAAAELDIEEAAIRAVHQVESGGRNGFLPDGRPIILFEGHIFWDQLLKRGIDPNKYVAGNENILFPKWDRTSYKGGALEHRRLEAASKIDRESALCSASWGMFQIMGFNHKLCGYDTVEEYVSAMETGQQNQFDAFVRFLKATKMDAPLRNLDWAGFAKLYNGPGYQQNRYDDKLKEAYVKFKNR